MHLPSPLHVISLCTHASTVSPRFVASISAKCSSFPSIPSDFAPRRRSILSHDAALNVHRKHTETNIEEASTSSRSDISCNLRAYVCRDFAPYTSTAHIFSLSTCSRANFTCILIRGTFRTGRIYPRSRLFRGLSCSGSSMCVCKAIRTVSAQRVVSVAPFVSHPLSFARGTIPTRTTELF